MIVEGCGFREGRRLGTGGGQTEEKGDIAGEWRDDFLVMLMELFKNSMLGLNTGGKEKEQVEKSKKVQNDNISIQV